MKALILAGGKGTRLRPITFSMAKQLVPVANKPVLYYGLEAVRDAGIREVGMIVGDTHEAIEQAVGDGSQWGLKVTYLPQEAPLGLAHAVKVAQPFLKEEPFVMYLGDNIVRSGVAALVDEFERDKPDAMILLAQVPNPQQFGVAELDGDRVITLEEKPKEPRSDYALVGVYLFSSCIFEAVKAIKPSWRDEFEITDAIQYLIDSGKNVRSHKVKGWWKDTGDLDALLEANRLVLEDLVGIIEGKVDSHSRLFGPVSVGANSKIINTIIEGPSIIGSNCHLENCRIGPYTAIGDGVYLIGSGVHDSVVMPDCSIKNIGDRIKHSLLGRGVQVRCHPERSQAMQLMLGDNSVIELL
ncbi:MAG: glucose-1-phosphate thymidylyltransferase [bacterium]